MRLVRTTGLEPAREKPHKILSLMRLPIPPCPHISTNNRSFARLPEYNIKFLSYCQRFFGSFRKKTKNIFRVRGWGWHSPLPTVFSAIGMINGKSGGFRFPDPAVFIFLFSSSFLTERSARSKI